MGLKKCPVCGADNSELAKFCYSCGADLEVQQQPSVYDQPVAEYQPQYQETQAQEVPPTAVQRIIRHRRRVLLIRRDSIRHRRRALLTRKDSIRHRRRVLLIRKDSIRYRRRGFLTGNLF